MTANKSNRQGNFYLPDYPEFENWAQYTKAAREYIPQALGYGDEAPWTQAALADLLGVDVNYISILERGEKEPGKAFRLHLRRLMIMARNGLDPRAT
jgi:hypothetical protein